MKLIPQPKILEVKCGFLNKGGLKPVYSLSDDRLEKAIKKLPLSDDGNKLNIKITKDSGEGYTLKIEEDSVNIIAESVQAAFWAIQTLRQIFREENVPCLYIEDRPDFPYRCFYHDITRGKIPTVETFKRLIDNLAYYKVNALQVYSEHVFDFDEFKGVTVRTGCLTREEVHEIDDYCYENFIEFSPSIATFGHLYELLQQDEYKKYCMLRDYEPIESFWYERVNHHTIDPLNPESFEIIKSILDQTTSMFRSNKINIGGDETFDLKNGRYKELDTGRIYVDFVKKIIAHLKAQGKTVMMWPDVLLKHPEMIDELPEDVVLVSYGYGSNITRDRDYVEKIAEKGRVQMVAPSTNSWCRLIENTVLGEKSITLMTELGYDNGAIGVLNTNWGDWGHPCSIDMHMYGIVYGAERSWNVKTPADEEFAKRVDELVYGYNGAVDIIKRVSALATDTCYWDFGKFYSNSVYDGKLEVIIPDEETTKRVQKECLDVLDAVSKQKWGCDEYRQELLISVEGIAIMAELFSKFGGYPIERKTDTADWLKKYRSKWINKNKESELKEIEKMFIYLDNL